MVPISPLQATSLSPPVSASHPAIAIAGPTASGKSELALGIAEEFDGEIINYDSLHLVRHLDIGTAKPSVRDRERVPHHLIDVLDPAERSSAGDYQRRARAVMSEIRERGRVPVLVGGTGLYLRALLEGLFAGPRRSDYWRERLERTAETRGRAHIHRVLERLDPDAAGRIAPRDKPKVIRAIEVRLETGKRLSEHLDQEARTPLVGFSFTLIGLDPPRQALYDRINQRVVDMWERGLPEEVRGLLASDVAPTSKAFEAIGYRHVLDYLDGKTARDEAIMLMQRDTRRYAKRQLTWFNRQHSVQWFDGFGNDEKIRKRVHQFVKHALSAHSGPPPDTASRS